MKFKRIEILNILGITEMIIDNPGQINVIAGTNASGKSSLLKALRNVAEGGSLAPLRNIHAPDDDPSQIYLLIEHGGTDYQIDKHTTPKGEAITVKQRVGDTIAFEKISRPPQTFINTLFDKRSLNPLEFCLVDDKKRVQLLLEALDLPFDRVDMWASIGLEYLDFDPVDEEQHPLKEIADVRKMIFDRRTGINSDQRNKAASAEELKRTVPAVMPPEPEEIELKQRELEGEIAKLHGMKSQAEKERDAIKSACESEMKEAKELKSARLQVLTSEHIAKIEKFKAELRAEIDLVSKNMDTEIEALAHEHEIQTDDADLRYSEAMHEADEQQERITELSSEVASMTTAAEERARIDERRRMVDRFSAEADSLKGKSDHLTEALEKLDRYKANMTKELPIDGLDISDNVITVNGVRWADLNTQKQYDVSVQVAIHRQKSMGLDPLVIVDGAEQLDDENFRLMEESLCAANVSGWLARVTGIPTEVFFGPGASEKINEAYYKAESEKRNV